MATIITSTLKASGGDYSSIKDWIGDLLANTPDFVANDIIPTLECYNDWPLGLDESFVDFKSGFTTDTEHYFHIVTPISERHTGVAGTGFWFNSSASGVVLYSRNQHVTFDGVEVSAPNSNQLTFGASSNTTVKNSILHDIDSTGFSGSSGAKFENCIVYLTAPSSSSNVGKAFQNATLDNITAYISPDSGAYNGDVIFQNCVCNNVYMFHNHAKTTYDSFFGGSGDYNVGLAINGDLPGANSFYITDDSDLVDPDNFDFRIKSTSPLATAGSGGGRIGAYYETGGGGETIESIPLSIMNGGYLSTIESLLVGVSSPKSVKSVESINTLSSSKTSLGGLFTLTCDEKLVDLTTTKSSLSAPTTIVSEDEVPTLVTTKTSSEVLETVENKNLISTFTPTMTGYSNLSGVSQGVKLNTIQTDYEIVLEVYTVKGVGLLGEISTTKTTRSELQGVLSSNLSNDINSSKTSLSSPETVEVAEAVSNILSTATKVESIGSVYNYSYVNTIEDYNNTTLNVFSISSVSLLGKIETTKVSNEQISSLEVKEYLGGLTPTKSVTESLVILENNIYSNSITTTRLVSESLGSLYSNNLASIIETSKTITSVPLTIEVKSLVNSIIILTGYMPTFSFDDIKTISASITFSTVVEENRFKTESTTTINKTTNK